MSVRMVISAPIPKATSSVVRSNFGLLGHLGEFHRRWAAHATVTSPQCNKKTTAEPRIIRLSRESETFSTDLRKCVISPMPVKYKSRYEMPRRIGSGSFLIQHLACERAFTSFVNIAPLPQKLRPWSGRSYYG